MNIFSTFIWLVIIAVGGAYVYLLHQTSEAEKSPQQAQFMAGTADMTSFNGVYKGATTGYIGTWQGKTIDAKAAQGINRFNDNGTVTERYVFALKTGQALRDAGKDVIILDYNQPGNPWWLTYIVDEMVQTGPDQYLGKVHLRIAPSLTFTLTYFTLTKETAQ